MTTIATSASAVDGFNSNATTPDRQATDRAAERHEDSQLLGRLTGLFLLLVTGYLLLVTWPYPPPASTGAVKRSSTTRSVAKSVEIESMLATCLPSTTASRSLLPSGSLIVVVSG